MVNRLISLIRLSAQGVARYPVRTVMTVLGIMWGVMSFMVLMSYGYGFQRALDVGLSFFGDNVVVVWNGQTSKHSGGQKAGRPIKMEKRDVEAVREGTTLIKNVSAEVFRRFKIRYDDRLITAGVRAVNACYGQMRGMFIKEGRFFTTEENSRMARVVVLGHDVKQRLFSHMSAVGKEVKIRGIPFTIIGVLKKKVSISNYFEPDDECVMLPVNTMSILADTHYLSVMVFRSVNLSFEKEAIGQFMRVMASRHHFDPSDKTALSVMSFSERKNIIDGLSNAVKITVIIVGLITLCIGGVGMMNIMLLSVKSRTREIGTLMAIGAKKREVVLQFLVESLIISALGGISGYLFTWILVKLIGSIPFLSTVMEDTSGRGDIHLLLGATTFFVSMFFLGLVSIVFGLWPALQAAKMNPVEALKYE